LYLLFFLFFIIGCSQEVPLKLPSKKVETKWGEHIQDLKDIDQNISTYIPTHFKSTYISSLERYEKKYFIPWNIKKIDISLYDATWAYRAFNAENSFGENLQPLKANFFDDIYKRSNFEEFATLNKKAITLKRLNIRAFPTIKPLLMDPKKAGEGFPFDYLQNSLIAANKPILVSHYSRDREWVFVETSFTYGWVKSADIAFIPQKYTQLYEEAQKEFLTKDGIPIYDRKGNFLFRSRIGMMLAEISEDSGSYTVLTIGKYKNTQAYYMQSKLSKDLAHKSILKFNKKNIIAIFKQVSNTKYGWGGMYGQRDCSSTLRDFYAPFGLWLPRNSYKQSKVGKVISLVGLSDDEKLNMIKEKGIPFKTLLYKRGHILLYVGIKKGRVIVFHNTWGVKTDKNGVEGRFLIGKSIFSSLKVGSNLQYYDEDASLLRNLKSMNILTE
jgi:hypothetical protein